MKKTFLLTFFVVLVIGTQAQWKVGGQFGATYNIHNRGNEYAYDMRYAAFFGLNGGVTGQYNFNDWFGLRVDASYMGRNWIMYRGGVLQGLVEQWKNNYLMMPVMANFSLGGERVRGYANFGLYGGYWLNSKISGNELELLNETYHYENLPYEFNKISDNRFDMGYVYGIGIQWRIGKHIELHDDVMCFYSVCSTKKDYQAYFDNPRYNTTIVNQIGVSYIF